MSPHSVDSGYTALAPRVPFIEKDVFMSSDLQRIIGSLSADAETIGGIIAALLSSISAG